MTKFHYIADEKLGGIEREYIESDLKAKVGDYIIGNMSGVVYLAKSVGVSGTVFGDSIVIAKAGNYTTLLPTDIVRVNGERYWLVDRKAEIGDKILTVQYEGGAAIPGDVLDVNFVEEGGNVDAEDAYFVSSGAYDDEYIVIEPISADKHAKESSNTDPTTPDLVDLVIRLTRTVAELEKELSAMGDVLGRRIDWSDYKIIEVKETATVADYKAGQALTSTELQSEKIDEISDKAEMVMDDIVTLDGRTMGCRMCGGHR